MEIIQGTLGSRLLLVRLDPGEDLLESLNKVIAEEGIRSGVVVSGIGSLSRCRFHQVHEGVAPGLEARDRTFHDLEGVWELGSVQGIIADGEPHLHIAVGDQERNFHGHLEKGCVVFTLAEVAVLVADAPVKREVRTPAKIKQLTRG